MSLLQNSNAIPQLGGYNLTDSLRFRASADTYLSRTNSSAATLATKATISLWVKRCRNGSVRDYIIQTGTGTGNNNYFSLFFTTSGPDSLKVGQYSVNAYVNDITRYRDPSAWYHLVCAFDSTLGTAADRCKIWINGELTTNVSGAAGASSNCALTNNGQTVYIGREAGYPSDVYMTEFHLIDGQALTASDFGEYDNTTGVWKPKAYTGTYGNNGFYLNMSTSGSTVLDQSGNGNNWTATNMNLTTSTATTYDKMTDVPTLTDEDTGNFATFNAINKPSSHTLSNGNLTTAITSVGGIDSTIGVSSGKWYCEVTLSTVGTDTQLGVTNITNGYVSAYLGQYATSWGCITFNGNRIHNGSQSAYGSSFSNGDVGMIALDMDTGKWYCGKNGTWFDSGNPVTGTNPAHTGLTGVMKFAIGSNSSSGNHSINFGQRPFAYTPPTGFKKLNTYNLPDSSIKDGREYFDTAIWNGNGTARTIDNTITDASGVETGKAILFSPDLVWVKGRSNATYHMITDSVRGATKYLYSNDTLAEGTWTDQVTSFNTSGVGFDLGVDTNSTVNYSGRTFVGWIWRASDSSPVTNTDGSITSTVSANTTSGFSVVTYTGTGTAGTIGHGLGSAPEMIILKGRDANAGYDDWYVYHSSLGNGNKIFLNSTAASSATSVWDSTSPTNDVFSVRANTINTSGIAMVAYCFAEVEGFSKFGSWETVNVGGTPAAGFVYTGFRPKLIIWKAADTSSSYTSWGMQDTSRTTYNGDSETLHTLWANRNYAEGARGNGSSSGALGANGFQIDFLSNGFNIKGGGNSELASSGTYIYMAWAESPFKNSLAR